jgi:hypothetical protein
LITADKKSARIGSILRGRVPIPLFQPCAEQDRTPIRSMILLPVRSSYAAKKK